MDLSTRQLKAFIALSEQGSFTRAAAITRLSQPAFSALIQSLESSLGIRLFDRSTRRVEITAEGREFEISARRVLSEFDGAMEGVRDSSARRRGCVSIALLPSLAASWLPGVLSKFHAAYPGIQLIVSDVLSEQCIDLVNTRKADFCIAAKQVQSPGLRSQRFCSDEFHLVCPLGHPLTALKTIRPRDLVSYPFIQMLRTSSVRQIFDALVYPLQMTTMMEVEHMATVMGMVRSGMGISVVPSYSLFYFQHDDISVIKLEWKGLTRRIDLLRPSDKSLSLAAQSLYDFVLEHRPRN